MSWLWLCGSTGMLNSLLGKPSWRARSLKSQGVMLMNKNGHGLIQTLLPSFKSSQWFLSSLWFPANCHFHCILSPRSTNCFGNTLYSSSSLSAVLRNVGLLVTIKKFDIRMLPKCTRTCWWPSRNQIWRNRSNFCPLVPIKSGGERWGGNPHSSREAPCFRGSAAQKLAEQSAVSRAAFPRGALGCGITVPMPARTGRAGTLRRARWQACRQGKRRQRWSPPACCHPLLGTSGPQGHRSAAG